MVIDIGKLKEETENKAAGQGWFKKFYQKLKLVNLISQKDIIFFTQNLQVMIRSGLPLDRSLKTLAEQTKNHKFQNILQDLAKSTEQGIAFHESLKKYEKIFGQITINMVKAGEVSGKLEDVLKQIYLQIKKAHELKSKIKAAMIYPVIIVIAMIVIGIIMFIVVIPKITSLFDQMEAELPLATKILISTSNFTTNNGLFILLGVLVAIILFIASLKNKKISYFYHELSLGLPIFGEIIKKINLAKFSRTVSSLIKTDIPIVKTLNITSQIMSNKVYRKALKESAESIKSGASLTDILKTYPKLFPPIIIQMSAAGEETGSLDEILTEIASFYEEEIDQIMKTLPSIIEPLLILVLGVGVGAMAVAIIMPMYSLTQQM
ncbi:type II secretion system F family protein [Patescibacteria group bacterium]|nr:type II secretion system F family protein [Patescibacteria group bacterium]